MPGRVLIDGFINFWLPMARAWPPGAQMAAWIAFWAVLLTVPWWWRPSRKSLGQAAVTNEELCTGCTQCYLDCPYEAIAMIPPGVPRIGVETVARVDPALCVSCGICTGSCAPMVVGAPHRSGRDQLRQLQVRQVKSVKRRAPAPELVVYVCQEGLGARRALSALPGVRVESLPCAGELHTSSVEFLVRSGAQGVFVMTCPERNCVHREGPRWLAGRFYHEREAELKERVDRRRLRLGQFAYSDLPDALAALRRFRAELEALDQPSAAEDEVELDLECELPEVGHG
jgi:NAD-dependent dihydropyrimidine dehydrogenase PreA subunit/coenzyme F420-reducing hydrogenase delta subunit